MNKMAVRKDTMKCLIVKQFYYLPCDLISCGVKGSNFRIWNVRIQYLIVA